MPVDDKPIRRGSKAKGKGDDDEQWMDENRKEDAAWKKMQQNTFTRYGQVNFHLESFSISPYTWAYPKLDGPMNT